MKAIHNLSTLYILFNSTVFNTSKIQNESNSQPMFVEYFIPYYCVQYVKDTK